MTGWMVRMMSLVRMRLQLLQRIYVQHKHTGYTHFYIRTLFQDVISIFEPFNGNKFHTLRTLYGLETKFLMLFHFRAACLIHKVYKSLSDQGFKNSFIFVAERKYYFQLWFLYKVKSNIYLHRNMLICRKIRKNYNGLNGHVSFITNLFHFNL